MKLSHYIDTNKISIPDFADKVGKTKDTIYKWLRGDRKPEDDETFRAIFDATGGQVTANDFFDLPPSKKPNNLSLRAPSGRVTRGEAKS